MLERKITKEIVDWIDTSSNEVLLVDGARQVGKTFAIEHVLKDKFSSHITIDFFKNPELCDLFSGSLDSEKIINNILMAFPSFRLIPGRTAIFLDEIQSCPHARTALKYLAQDERIKVIASGSLLGLNYKKVDSYPVGYERRITLRSLDFEEFLWAVGIDRTIIASVKTNIQSKRDIEGFILSKFDELYREYMVVGGMPEAVSRFLSNCNIDAVRKVQEKIVLGYRSDVSKHASPFIRDRIFTCFDSVPHQLSRDDKKFVYAEVVDDAPTKNGQRYSSSIQWLIDAGIVSKCYNLSEPKSPLEENVKENMFKLYMNDTGLLSFILGRDIQIAILKGDHRVNRGAIQENITAECLSKGGVPLRYFSTVSMEVDFIASFNGNIAAMEVKSGNNKRSQSLKSVMDKYGVRRRIKFEIGNISVDGNGIEHYPLFASAFVDSLYRKGEYVFVDDTEDFNRKAKAMMEPAHKM